VREDPRRLPRQGIGGFSCRNADAFKGEGGETGKRCGMSDQLEERLSHVMIRCAKSGEGVPAEMEIDAASFEIGDFSDQTVKCPHCGQVHTWSAEDAWLEDVY
jgi:hypothetical protein